MENLKQDRERQTLTPMEKMEAEKMMNFRRKEKQICFSKLITSGCIDEEISTVLKPIE